MTARRAAHLQLRGFTIVELLIVVVVIAILATITVVAYTNIQARARDSQRQQDVKTIAKALELYYLDKGAYPAGSGATTTGMNTAWSTTVDSSWSNLKSALVPAYISDLPTDPGNTSGSDPRFSGSYGYAYYSNTSTYCGVTGRQMYILTYRVEGGAQADTLIGNCPTNVLRYPQASNYRVVK